MKKKYAKYIFCLLGIVSLCLIIFRFLNPTSLNKPSIYYFSIPLIMFFLVIKWDKLSTNIHSLITNTFTYLVIFLYSVEFFFQLNPVSFEKRKNKYFEENNLESRTIEEIYYEEIKNDNEKTLYFPPQYHLKYNNHLSENKIFPLSGISKKDTIMCNESGFYNSYISDRYGFNNDDKIYDKEKISFILIGDSFAHGACVNKNQDLIFNLKNKPFFKGKEIYNLSYSGNGLLLSYAALKEYFPKNKSADYIIWVYYEKNDLIEFKKEYSNSLLKNYIENNNFSQKLILKQSEINSLLQKKFKQNFEINKKNKVKNIISFLSLDSIRKKVFKLFKKKYVLNQELISNFSQIVSLIKKFSIDNESEIIFVYLPGREDQNEGSYYYKNIINILRKNNIRTIDLKKDSFYKESKNYPKYGAHFNSKGYEELASKISDYFK